MRITCPSCHVNLDAVAEVVSVVVEEWEDEINMVDPDAEEDARQRRLSHLAMSTPDGPDGLCYYDRHPEEPRPVDLPPWSAGSLGLA